MAIILNYKKGKKMGEEIERKKKEEREGNRSERSNKSMDLKDYEFLLEKASAASIHSFMNTPARFSNLPSAST